MWFVSTVSKFAASSLFHCISEISRAPMALAISVSTEKEFNKVSHLFMASEVGKIFETNLKEKPDNNPIALISVKI